VRGWVSVKVLSEPQGRDRAPRAAAAPAAAAPAASSAGGGSGTASRGRDGFREISTGKLVKHRRMR